MTILSPAKQLTCLEDYVPGSTYTFGFYAVTEQEIISFAKLYDPQEMHTDKAKATVGEYRGLIASGWHTASMTMRLLADNYLPSHASLASPGIDELRWLSPVRPGDKLGVRIEVEEARRSRSRTDRGVLVSQCATFNQGGTTVMTMKTVSLVLTRDALEAQLKLRAAALAI